ncbi:unnamed protein product [Clonostachys rosea]|uniref:Actin-like ATPase domain-containing protein n=1 Tax=Bionectria ochroleuca TaxID=29856 RepID=A0ABY6UGW0_BIOOC|nr:unnamed protein product [Clonostachys rosea]
MIEPVTSYLDILNTPTGEAGTVMAYPPPERREIPLHGIMEFPKVALMDRRNQKPGERAMMEAVYRTWKEIKLPYHKPSAIFLEDFFQSVLSEYRRVARPGISPAVIMCHPSGFSTAEIRQFQDAIKDAKINQRACKRHSKTDFTEGEAVIYTALKDHSEVLKNAHRNNEAIIVADYGGITDEIAIFHFDHSLGGSSTLPGRIKKKKSTWTGAQATIHAFQMELLKEAQLDAGRTDQQFPTDIQDDLHKAVRRWAAEDLPNYRRIDFEDLGFECTLGGESTVLRAQTIEALLKSSAEIKAMELFDLIEAPDQATPPPTYLMLCGGFSKCKLLYDRVIGLLADKLRTRRPPIQMPHVLEFPAGQDP